MLSRAQCFAIPWTAWSSVLHYLSEFAQIHVHWVGDAIQPSHPLLPLSPLSSVFPSIRVFSNESALGIRWPKYWSFSNRLFNEYSGLISLGLTDLISLQSKNSQESSSTLQFKSINSSVLSFLYSPTLTSIHITGKTIALTRQTFVDKVMSLLFNMLSRLVIIFIVS